jgi:hemerythrin
MNMATQAAAPERLILEPEYCLGHTVLDQQHAELLRLVNQLAECIEKNNSDDSEEFHSILNDLMDLTKAHFYSEESFVSRQGSLPASKYQAGCEEYEERMTHFLFSATFGVVDKSGLAQYLSGWWKQHIQDMAMQATRNKR